MCHDYQEIKIQESAQVMGVGSIPRSIPIILMDDLVDTVKAGGTTIIKNFHVFTIHILFNGLYFFFPIGCNTSLAFAPKVIDVTYLVD